MQSRNKWLLPEGIEEILPPQAAALERLCRRIMDQFALWGYELVMPPLLEYLDTLLAGASDDLALQTFKVTDQLNGRLMGVRADTTPQVARIDAHNLARERPNRLCYLGPVLRTLAGEPGGTRSPLQVGAELYGHPGPESDAEILALALKTLQLAGERRVFIDIGHVGVIRGLVEQLGLAPAQEREMFSCLRRKASAELGMALAQWSVPARQAEALTRLMYLEGDAAVLDEARTLLEPWGERPRACVDELEKIAALVRRQVKDAPLYFDVTGLQGYHYHTGLTFVAYAPGENQEIAFGGRYDNIGQGQGESRPATGFSTDAVKLLRLSPQPYAPQPGIYAPGSEAPGLADLVERLRAQGEVVIVELPGQDGGAKEMGCDRKITLKHGQWRVDKI